MKDMSLLSGFPLFSRHDKEVVALIYCVNLSFGQAALAHNMAPVAKKANVSRLFNLR